MKFLPRLKTEAFRLPCSALTSAAILKHRVHPALGSWCHHLANVQQVRSFRAVLQRGRRINLRKTVRLVGCTVTIMPTLTVNWEPPPGPWAPEFLDEVQQEVEELLPMVLEARRARRQEIYELLMDMLTSDIKLRRFTGE